MSDDAIRLWDLPTRLFHWLLVIAVSGAVITVKLGGTWMVWHERFGMMVLGLVSFRLVWGLAGTRYVRFSQFLTGPRGIIDYLQGRWRGVGHNPLGAWSVMAMLAVLGFQSVSGLFAFDDIAFGGPLRRAVSSEWSSRITGWHSGGEWLILGLIALHLAAVFFYLLVRRDNLITPMISGRKRGAEGDAAGAVRWWALLLAFVVVGAVLWVANGGLLPPPAPPPVDLGW
ncbi:MAG: cytochrome b/b6 domain-containing protein [Alcanivoracaceae bacterium]